MAKIMNGMMIVLLCLWLAGCATSVPTVVQLVPADEQVKIGVDSTVKKCVSGDCTVSLSTVMVQTVPAGGLVKVDEVGIIVEDGGKIKLPKGRYTFSREQAYQSPGGVIVTLDGRENRELVIPLGRVKPTDFNFARLEVATSPVGGTVHIVEMNRTVSAGSDIALLPGNYTLQGKLTGYRPKTVSVSVDELQRESVLIVFDEGFAKIELSTHPAGATIFIDGKLRGETPEKLELDQGKHQLQISMDGYYPLEKTFVVAAGNDQQLTLDLQQVPTSAVVNVTTDPAGGMITFRGKAVGHAQVKLGRLDFGQYMVSGIKQLNDQVRLVGRQRFELTKSRNHKVKILLTQRERKFAGQWLPESTALARERQRYIQQRGAQSLALQIAFSAADLSPFASAQNFAEQLHKILRVGDHVILTCDNLSWDFWKRNRLLTPDFYATAQALFGQQSYRLPWRVEKSQSITGGVVTGGLIEYCAFMLQANRAELALLDLNQRYLAATGETIYRSVADGLITILVHADHAPELPGEVVVVGDSLWLATVATGNSPLVLSWSSIPKRLLVMSEASIPFGNALAETTQLLIHEKRIVTLADKVEVVGLMRLSAGPDFKSVVRDNFEKSGPLAGQINLNNDEIGPHEKAGNYERVWLVYYSKDGIMSQRQIVANYVVVDEKKDFSADEFLRRRTSKNR